MEPEARGGIAPEARSGTQPHAARAGLREWTLGHDPLRLCVPLDHPLAGAPGCAMTELAGEAWVMCPDTSLGRLVRSMCIAAGFQPRVGATVHDVGTALSLVGIGWGITIAPELTPAGTPAGSPGCRSRASTPCGTASSSSATASTAHRGWPRRSRPSAR